ncbi:tyrosine-type recombinase/integrase [Pseudomonas veronii]|uniref:Integrase arm-type DNA-binding domain-containing protein n=1 Tax=Pseudomonas veronii TaxID=76761 RepID=A0A7Y1ADQ0_PSEVE|nr:integrase arm-type DNA-binding domain-containing protein [Pseudomonas veronii]NMY13692.1 integrase arm-type DNA-binding domain-containing protein [Pseudomonas veronii]
MALSCAVVRNAKPRSKPYNLSDGKGLSLLVPATGSRAWHFRYMWGGKQRRMSFGVYPEISLYDARRLRTEARGLLAKCINPQRHRAQARQEREMAGDFTFQRLYDLWYAHRALSLNNGRNSTLEQIQRVFKKDVLPRLGKRSVYRINRFDLLAVLEQIEQRRAFTVAEKCRTWFAQLFRYALVKVPRLRQNPSSELEVLAVPERAP